MKPIALIFTILFFTTALFAQNKRNVKTICTDFNALNTAILNGSINKKEAIHKVKLLMQELYSSSPEFHTRSWVFPLQGYNYRVIGGTNGNGYYAKGYSYFDGNKHTAHPAHDIFITDKNQDCVDDRTRLPVNVLAINDGIVFACTNEWTANSPLRGGKYIWIYHPAQNMISYYAHNKAIFVQPGDIVKQGQKIAEVGRTGLNAYKKRSPTHLHFSAFHVINDLPVAYNCYSDLKRAESL